MRLPEAWLDHDAEADGRHPGDSHACHPCHRERPHAWHDNGSPSDLAPYLPGGSGAPPTHKDTP